MHVTFKLHHMHNPSHFSYLTLHILIEIFYIFSYFYAFFNACIKGLLWDDESLNLLRFNASLGDLR